MNMLQESIGLETHLINYHLPIFFGDELDMLTLNSISTRPTMALLVKADNIDLTRFNHSHPYLSTQSRIAIFEALCAIRAAIDYAKICDIDNCLAYQRQYSFAMHCAQTALGYDRKKKQSSKLSNDTKHAQSRQDKASVIDYYIAHKSDFKTKGDAANKIPKLLGIKAAHATVYNWLKDTC